MGMDSVEVWPQQVDPAQNEVRPNVPLVPAYTESATGTQRTRMVWYGTCM